MTTDYPMHQQICNDVTQLQLQLDVLLQSLFDQAGSRIQVDRQTELRQSIEITKQQLENLKGRYECLV
jgi:regulation of enolase protein 1 (concanavalin A-like superfamily)